MELLFVLGGDIDRVPRGMLRSCFCRDKRLGVAGADWDGIDAMLWSASLVLLLPSITDDGSSDCRSCKAVSLVYVDAAAPAAFLRPSL